VNLPRVLQGVVCVRRHFFALCAVFIFIELSSASAWATTMSYNFGTKTGMLGNSQTYNVSGVTITAYGFSSGGATHLYAKNDSALESGLGLANDPSGQHEITKGSFVQLDISQLAAKGFTSASIFVNSVQPGESWDLFASNTLGKLGTLEISNSQVANKAVSISSWLKFKYISLTAHFKGQDNVLLGQITAGKSVPDSGSTVTLLFGALCGLGFLRSKLSRPQSGR
jgi:hypothetical protein